MKRCAFKRKRVDGMLVTIVRCWCIVEGSCSRKCNCRGPSYFPYMRVKFTPFAVPTVSPEVE